MAGSNWDHIWFNGKGEAALWNKIVSPVGIFPEFYKADLLLSHPNGGKLITDTPVIGWLGVVVAIVDGTSSLRIKDVFVHTIEENDGSVMYAVIHWHTESGWVIYAGIGCYGYGEGSEWIGVTVDEVEQLRDYIKAWLRVYAIPKDEGEALCEALDARISKQEGKVSWEH